MSKIVAKKEGESIFGIASSSSAPAFEVEPLTGHQTRVHTNIDFSNHQQQTITKIIQYLTLPLAQ